MAKGKKMNETNLAVADHESLFFVLYSFRALDSFLVIQGGTRFRRTQTAASLSLKGGPYLSLFSQGAAESLFLVFHSILKSVKFCK